MDAKRSIRLMTLVGLLTCGGPGGCGSATLLRGSVEVDLAFDTFTASAHGTQLLLTYGRKAGDVVAAIALETQGAALSNGKTMSQSDFIKFATVSRNMTDSSLLPPILQGYIKFDRFTLTPGHPVSGNFFIVFVKGTTLEGTFEGKL